MQFAHFYVIWILFIRLELINKLSNIKEQSNKDFLA